MSVYACFCEGDHDTLPRSQWCAPCQDRTPSQELERTTPKRERRRLAKAELLMHLALAADAWAAMVDGSDPKCRPIEEWPADDPLVTLARTYALTPKDLAGLCRQLAQEMENRSERAGYADRWEEVAA